MRQLKHYHHRKYGDRLMCIARGKLVLATPEEFVRQSVMRTLIEEYGYPRGALRAEEPVARGTKDRGRADVIVELPSRLAGKHRAELRSGEEGPAAQLYSARRQRVLDALHDAPGIAMFEVPDFLDVPVDGVEVSYRVVGFGPEDFVELWLELVSDDPGLPVFLRLGFFEDAMSPLECEVANRLGLPLQSELLETLSSQLDDLLMYELARNSAVWSCVEGSYWTVLRSNDEDAGVLVSVERNEPLWAAHYARGEEQYFGRWYDQFDEVSAGDDILVSLDLDDPPLTARATGRSREFIEADLRGAPIRAYCEPPDGEHWFIGPATVGMEALAEAGLGAVAGTRRSFIVVECKAPSVAYSEEVRAQGARYATAVASRYLVLTNGEWVRTFLVNEGELEPIAELPSYTAAVADDTYLVDRRPPKPAQVPLPARTRNVCDVVRLHRCARRSIGFEVPEDSWVPILRLEDLLHSQCDYRPPSSSELVFEQDLGLQHHEPGNTSGGSYPGLYRDFAIKWRGRDAIFGAMLSSHTRGSTYLLGCISFGAVYHPVLQLDFPRYSRIHDDRIDLWHSGRMTVGRGQVPKMSVLEYITEHAPEIVDEDEVRLGGYSATAPTQAEAQDILMRLAVYTAARHDFKEAVRASRKR